MATHAGDPGKASAGDEDGTVNTSIDYDASRHSPRVLIVDESVRADLFELWLDDFNVESAVSRRQVTETFDGTVSVAIVRNELPDEVKSDLQSLIASRAPFCRTIITTTERVEIMYPGIEYDVCLSEPTNREGVQETVGRLLLRARYDANLRNYYECSMRATNREVQLDSEELAADEQYQQLSERMSTIKDRLDTILAHFDEDDLDAVQQSIRPDVGFGSGTKQKNKQRGEKYRPDKCVGCGLEWGVDHGGTIGDGYKRLGAFVWECAECGAVQNMPDPSHRRVAWR